MISFLEMGLSSPVIRATVDMDLRSQRLFRKQRFPWLLRGMISSGKPKPVPVRQLLLEFP
jgi:hypothetical protein